MWIIETPQNGNTFSNKEFNGGQTGVSIVVEHEPKVCSCFIENFGHAAKNKNISWEKRTLTSLQSIWNSILLKIVVSLSFINYTWNSWLGKYSSFIAIIDIYVTCPSVTMNKNSTEMKNSCVSTNVPMCCKLVLPFTNLSDKRNAILIRVAIELENYTMLFAARRGEKQFKSLT